VGLMSDQREGVFVRYSIEELLKQLNDKIDQIGIQLQGSQGRTLAIEGRLIEVDALVRDFNEFKKDFIGFEKRMSLHETLPGHGPMVTALATLQLDVGHLKAQEQIQERLTAYMAEVTHQNEDQRKQASDAHRWRVGLTVTALFQSVGLLLVIAKAFGWIA
jgi:hypothetical protein